jgi:O-antigen ligase/tetratricopeptide (TPR) repeat protein
MASNITNRAPLGDKWLALAALLPAVLLASPVANPIAGDFATGEFSASGFALLASLPAAFLVALKRVAPVRGLLLFLCAWIALAALPGGSDSLARERTWMVFATGAVLALAGGGLGAGGRTWLVRGLMIASALFLGRAVIAGDPGGVLGNSGELSAAALPGSLCGLLIWVRCKSAWRWLGLAVLVLLVVHASSAPVLTSLVALFVVATVAWMQSAKSAIRSEARIKLALVVALALCAFGWVRYAPLSSPGSELAAIPETQPAELQSPQNAAFGGVEVRRRIFFATLDLVADAPLRGVGAGQFAAAFPAYRDPRELELSNLEGRLEGLTEVEHPHNDWILPFAEGGLAVGFAWAGFLSLVLLAAVRGLAAAQASDAALAAGSLAVLVSALAGSPLFHNPAAQVAAMVLFGALLSMGQGPAPRRGRRLVGASACVVLVLTIPGAWSMWRMGRALRDITLTTSVTAKSLALDEALRAAPDSVEALSLKARLSQSRGDDLAASLALWERVLDLRPLRFEALMNSGQILAQRGDLVMAWERFEAATLLDPRHPGLMRNRLAGAADRGRIAEALAELDALEAGGHGDPLWLFNLACDLVLRGQDREGLVLMARTDERLKDLSAEQCWELDAKYRLGGSHIAADAFKALAHVLWGRDQARAGDWDDARRSYRQNLRITRERVPPQGPTRLRMEMAAVLWRSRMPEDAQQLLAGLTPRPVDWLALPPWAGEALLEMKFAGAGE